MSSPYQAQYEQLRSVAHGSISNSYTALGTALAHPSRILKLANTTDADILISIDGSNDYDVIPAGAASVYDLCTNRRNRDEKFEFPAGTQFYAKYVSAPTKNSIYLITIFGE